jgi:glycosyltransferase involved in cell wall biosynthesis
MSSLAIFLPCLYGGGVERVLVNLMRGFVEQGLVEQGLKIDLVLAFVEGPYLSLVPPEVRIVDLECKRLRASLPALVRYLKENKPAVLLTAMEDTNLIALWSRVLAGVSTRVVVSVHNTLSQESQNATQLKRRMAPYFARLFYPWADAVVTVSEGAAEDLARLGLSKEQIKVIYNPVVTPDLFKKITEPPDHPWFEPGSPPVILGVGRLEKQKDFATLIRAFDQVQQHRPARLMLLGEGKERPYLEALVQELGLAKNVALPGFVANPYAYMARAGVFVLSSLYEGLPTVLIEAMAGGTRVVSTDCESGPAEILENGQYGKLVPVGDIKGISEAIISTLEKPCDSEALRRKAAEFSLERALAEYRQVLQIS